MEPKLEEVLSLDSTERGDRDFGAAGGISGRIDILKKMNYY